MKAEMAEAARRKREAEEKEAKKMEWGKGLVQREEKEQERALMEKERHKGFARRADDAELNEELKAKELWNDPAAAFITVSLVYQLHSFKPLTATQKKRSKGPRRPEYTGPTPPPNRFGIKPGYRWDGVDRSTGFEQKYFQRQNERKRQGAESYSWSVDDM
jgi:pre-mRNA-splicing factor CWC26